MSNVAINIVLIMVLVVIQGVFVAAELALVSLRESQTGQWRTAAGADSSSRA